MPPAQPAVLGGVNSKDCSSVGHVQKINTDGSITCAADTGTSAGVSSFNSRTGAVTPQAGDYTAALVTNAVDAAQSYSNPNWITHLDYSKLNGTLPTLATYLPGWSCTGSGSSQVCTASGSFAAGAMCPSGAPAGSVCAGGEVVAPNINGTMYISPSSDTTGVTENATLQAAITTGAPVVLLPGLHYLTGNLTISAPPTIHGSGPDQTFIAITSATNNLMNISYGLVSILNDQGPGAEINGFTIEEASGVTPTAGYAFNMSGVSSAGYLSGMNIHDVEMWGLFGGINYGSWEITNKIAVRCMMFVSGGHGCLNYNNSTPGGDTYWEIQAEGANTGVTIQQSDTQTFTNLKLNGSGVVFTQAGAANYVRFGNASIEGVSSVPSCGIDFGTGSYPPNGIYIESGQIDLVPTALCHTANTTGLQYSYEEYVTTAHSGGTPVLVTNIGGASYPPAGVPNSTGVGWGSSYTPGAANGLATLNSSGQVPSSQLPATSFAALRRA